ncbi:hypothetical protein ACWDA3_33315 [Nonomuraea rubra]
MDTRHPHRIEAREHWLTCQIEQTQTEIDTLTARLSELSEQAEHLRISRKTLISLAKEEPRTDRNAHVASALTCPTTYTLSWFSLPAGPADEGRFYTTRRDVTRMASVVTGYVG